MSEQPLWGPSWIFIFSRDLKKHTTPMKSLKTKIPGTQLKWVRCKPGSCGLKNILTKLYIPVYIPIPIKRSYKLTPTHEGVYKMIHSSDKLP